MNTIYLVEDDRILSNLTYKALAGKNYVVQVFDRAQKLMDHLTEQIPDVILMDIKLPDMSGSEAVKRIRKFYHIDIPVIFLTGMVADEVDLEESGITIDGINYRTLEKPYEIKSLIKAIEDVIALARKVS